MDKGLKRIISNNLYMLKYIFKYAPGLVLGSLFQSVLSTASSIIATIYSVKYIIDSIQFERGYHSVFMALAAIAAVTVANLLYSALFGSIYVRITLEKLNKKMQSQIFEKASKIDLACYEDPEFYNGFTWAMGEADKRAYGAFQTLNMVFKNLLMVMGVGALVLALDKLSFVFIAVSVALNCAFSSRVNKLRFDMADELKPQQRRQGYVSRVFYLPYYAKELRTTDIKPKLIKDYSGVVKDIKLIIDRYGKKLSLLNFICGFMCNTFIFDGLYLLYLSYKVIAEKVLSYGSFTALVRASSSIKDSINSIAMAGPQFYQHSLYIDKFRTFMEYRPGIKSPENPAGVPSMPVVLEFKNVSFSYMGEERQALKNISLTIRAGEKIALVGRNGAGKSTLIKLMLRLYDTDEGEICLNGKNIKEYDLKEYREIFGTAFQDYQIFAASLGENVVMDSFDSSKALRIEHALKVSGFGERLAAMEQGIYTPLTCEFCREGVNLSAGEAQKVAISRVFAGKSPIMILDEPSSSLDPIAEYELNKVMKNITKNKAVVFISHRLSTTRMADKIYLLEDGRIIEAGSHYELMQKNGEYAMMFNLQAERYRAEKGLDDCAL